MRNAFIKLLNDTFLRLELTEQYYEASGKDDLTNYIMIDSQVNAYTDMHIAARIYFLLY